MMHLPKNPLLYEIHTAAWLNRLSVIAGHKVDLSNIPNSEIDKLVDIGVNIVWLMGVWKRSPVAVQIDADNKQLQEHFQSVLPDFEPKDAIGSAYAVQDYVVDERFGGQAALADFREQLKNRGIGLMLDFVPNHVAIDHPWVTQYPDIFVRGTEHDLLDSPANFIRIDGKVFAKGRDPHFDAWPDVLQLNAFSDQYRKLAKQTLLSIAAQCDAVRCDMSMLLLNRIFQDTWSKYVNDSPQTEFWQDVITEVRKQYPDFIFMAECYWNTEAELVNLGFNYCYDKILYDQLITGNTQVVTNHLQSTLQLRPHLVSFIENHDEQRASNILDSRQLLAATVLVCTLPGTRFLHDGQLEGFKVKIPVQLRRGPAEEVNTENIAYFRDFFAFLKQLDFSKLTWQLLPTNNPNIITYEWIGEQTQLKVHINYSQDSVDNLKPWQVQLLAGKHSSFVR